MMAFRCFLCLCWFALGAPGLWLVILGVWFTSVALGADS